MEVIYSPLQSEMLSIPWACGVLRGLPVFDCVIRKKRTDEGRMLLFHFALNKCLSDLDLECCIMLINAIFSREEIATSRSCLRILIIGQKFQHSSSVAFSSWSEM